ERLDAGALGAGLHLPVSELKRLKRTLVDALQRQLKAPPAFAQASGSIANGSVLPSLKRDLSTGIGASSGEPVLVPLCRTEEQLDALIASGAFVGGEVELDWMEMVGLSRAVRKAKEAGLSVTRATVRVRKPGEEAYDRRIGNLA